MKLNYSITQIQQFLKEEKNIIWNKIKFDKKFNQPREIKEEEIFGHLDLICISPIDQKEFRLSIYVDNNTFYFSNNKHTTEENKYISIEILNIAWKEFLSKQNHKTPQSNFEV